MLKSFHRLAPVLFGRASIRSLCSQVGSDASENATERAPAAEDVPSAALPVSHPPPKELHDRILHKTSLFQGMRGGERGAAERAQHAQRIREALREELPPPCKTNPEDFLWANENHCFVGVGMSTNWPGLWGVGHKGVLQSKRLVAVRDVFDRTPERPTLRSFFRLITDDTCLLLKEVQKSPYRRLVNEYEYQADGKFHTLRHDMDFVDWLHLHGFRVVPVATQTQLASFQPGDLKAQQSTNNVLMVSPTAFESNVSAAADNYFMMSPEEVMRRGSSIKRQVLNEFANLHTELTSKAGIHVHLFTHEPFHDTPDAVFPNNWFSTHSNLETDDECILVRYPMRSPSRRKERRPEFMSRFQSFNRYTIIDLTEQESTTNPRFLEGTGSLVLDRIHRLAYVALSERSSLPLARTWARVMGYELIPFHALDEANRPIYHTNVMMSIGTNVAVVCSESVKDPRERDMLLARLREHQAVVEITHAQMNSFCGNVLELESRLGDPVMAMSTSAYNAFTDENKAVLLGGVTQLIHADVSTLEKVGGGGVRCSIGEIF